MKYTFKFLVFLIAISVAGCKDKDNIIAKEIDDYTSKIDSLIQTKKPRKFNGVILITKDIDTIYSKAYGYSNFEEKTPINLTDNFRIQSISKQFAAVLILREVEKGNIDLKKTISNYLPEIKQPWAKKVTVHHLLNMSSGITSLDEPLLFQLESDFYYSNTGYGLLGKIIEKVTGKSYIQNANDLFREFNMDNTYCYELGMTKNKLINGYNIEDSSEEVNLVNIDSKLSSLPNLGEWWKDFIPAGGIISNLKDLSLWNQKFHNDIILKPETYALMIGNTNPNKTDYFKAYGKEKIEYGYGLCIADEPLTNIGHPGKGLGFGSYICYVPRKNLTVIVLQNLYYENSNIFFHFEKEIRQIVLNGNLDN